MIEFILASQLVNATDIAMATVRNIVDGVMDGSSYVLIGSAKIAAAIATAFAYIGIANKYLSGESLSAWGFLRPLVIFMLVCNFSTFVLRPIDFLVNIFVTPIERLSSEGMKEYGKNFLADWDPSASESAVSDGGSIASAASPFSMSFKDLKAILKENYNPNITDGRGRTVFDPLMGAFKCMTMSSSKVAVSTFFAERVSYGVKQAAGSAVQGRNYFLSKFLAWIASVLSNLVLLAFQIFAAVFICVLSILGPLTFAISIFSPFSGGIKLWIERFAEFSLWCPIANLLVAINYRLSNIILQVISDSTAGCSVLASDTATIMQLLTIILIFMTPKIASWVIETAGGSNVMSGIIGGAGRIAGMVVGK